MYDIELLLVKYGEFLFIVVPIFKWYLLVRNSRFISKSNLKTTKFSSFTMLWHFLVIFT